jgi:hypothetical protein
MDARSRATPGADAEGQGEVTIAGEGRYICNLVRKFRVIGYRAGKQYPDTGVYFPVN